MTNTLQSYIAGRWVGSEAKQLLRSAGNGRPVASTHAEALDFAEALHHARTVCLPVAKRGQGASNDPVPTAPARPEPVEGP